MRLRKKLYSYTSLSFILRSAAMSRAFPMAFSCALISFLISFHFMKEASLKSTGSSSLEYLMEVSTWALREMEELCVI